MKKILMIGLAATAMLTSCSNDENVEMPAQKAIGFANTFVNNGSRSVVDPSYSNTNLPADFAVYGFTQNGQIFNAQKVENTNGTWTYNPLQYWVGGNTYTFGAIAPYSQSTSVSGVTNTDGKINMSVAFTSDGTTDLLHAAPSSITLGATDDNHAPVAMDFNHMLSKVKFSFVNAVGDAYTVKVSNINITNAKETGTLTIAATNAWSDQNGSLSLDFGAAVAKDATAEATNEAAALANSAEGESYNEKLMIPTGADAEYTVTFDVELLIGETSIAKKSRTATIKGVELKTGFCYDFKAELTPETVLDPEKPLKPIEFTASVSDWNKENESQNLPIDDKE